VPSDEEIKFFEALSCDYVERDGKLILDDGKDSQKNQERMEKVLAHRCDSKGRDHLLLLQAKEVVRGAQLPEVKHADHGREGVHRQERLLEVPLRHREVLQSLPPPHPVRPRPRGLEEGDGGGDLALPRGGPPRVGLDLQLLRLHEQEGLVPDGNRHLRGAGEGISFRGPLCPGKDAQAQEEEQQHLQTSGDDVRAEVMGNHPRPCCCVSHTE